MNKGYYTIDNSDLYWYYKPRSKGKATVTLFYKYGIYKDMMVDKDTYVINEDRIRHWKEYKR